MSLTYQVGSLFDAPKGVILAHACNGQGVWGRGIAVEFKNRFPKSYEQYHDYCLGVKALRLGSDTSHVGKTFLCSKENDYRVACLITSLGFKAKTDPVDKILTQSETAINHLFEYMLEFCPNNFEIHSNKFNSGLFGVPWEKTEEVLKKCLEEFPMFRWVVWCNEE